MANPYQGDVDIELDKLRRLRFTTNAEVEYQDLSGTGLSEISFRMIEVNQETDDPHKRARLLSNRVGWPDLRRLLWAGLLHEDEKLTLRQVGELCDLAPGEGSIQKYLYIFTKLLEAIALYQGGNEAKKNSQSGLEESPREIETNSGDSSPGRRTPTGKSSKE